MLIAGCAGLSTIRVGVDRSAKFMMISVVGRVAFVIVMIDGWCEVMIVMLGAGSIAIIVGCRLIRVCLRGWHFVLRVRDFLVVASTGYFIVLVVFGSRWWPVIIIYICSMRSTCSRGYVPSSMSLRPKYTFSIAFHLSSPVH